LLTASFFSPPHFILSSLPIHSLLSVLYILRLPFNLPDSSLFNVLYVIPKFYFVNIF
jgi:hypothetical protein